MCLKRIILIQFVYPGKPKERFCWTLGKLAVKADDLDFREDYAAMKISRTYLL